MCPKHVKRLRIPDQMVKLRFPDHPRGIDLWGTFTRPDCDRGDEDTEAPSTATGRRSPAPV